MKKYQLIFTILDTKGSKTTCYAKSIEIEIKTFRQAFFEALKKVEDIKKEYTNNYYLSENTTGIYVYLVDIINKRK